jgi:ABC-type bacteriocin/lantibiotic exporter with double-glycine peptidase domain
MATYLIGINLVINNQVTIPELMFLSSQTHEFYHKIKDLRNIFYQYKRKRTRIDNIYKIIKCNDLERLDPLVGDKKFNPITKNSPIRFENIDFGYYPGKDKLILHNMSLDFEPRKINLLMGPNGSGKSTIVKLLMGLYEPQNSNSRISIGFVNTDQISKKVIRDKIKFVSQEPCIFDDTVINCSQIEEYAKILGLDKWFMANRNKQCGFLGKNLSGGEKKKIQLLHAICSDSEILIFDEPSNALDKVAISWFIGFAKQLRDKLNKTIIIITHDARLLELSDKTIMLNQVNNLDLLV